MNSKSHIHINNQQDKIRFFLRLVLLCLVTAVVIGVFITWGLTFHPEIVFWGFLSFTVMGIGLMLIAVASNLMRHIFLRKNYPLLLDFHRRKESEYLNTEKQAIKSSYFKKILTVERVCSILFIFLWVLTLVFVAVGTAVFKIPFLVNLLNNFK